MRDKTIVITGATSGLGEAAALAFAAEGATVVAVGRDAERGARVLAAMRAANPGGAHAFERVDLARASEARSFGARLATERRRIDALVNNAGGTFKTRAETADGIETTWALNVVAPFALTRALLPALEGGAVVNVVTRVLPGEKLDLGDLQSRAKYSGLKAYSRAKLALEMLTIEQAARYPATRFNCVHPGIIMGTRFGGGNSPAMVAIGKVFGTIFMFRSTEAQAVARFRQAIATPSTAGFFRSDRQHEFPPGARDAQARTALWSEVEKLAS